MWQVEMQSSELAHPFIKYCERGTLRHDSRAQYYRIRYDENRYTDSLFGEHNIPFSPHLYRAVRKRRAEYLAGRICGARILHHAGVADHVTSDPESRAPIWPSGIAGSISHCRDQAICVIYPRDQGHIGVDLEFLDAGVLAESADAIVPPLAPSVASQISLELVLLNFSAKESLFKALYPQVRQYFGFEYADLDDVSPLISSEFSTDGQFAITLNRDLSPEFSRARRWIGYYAYDAGTKFISTFLVDPA